MTFLRLLDKGDEKPFSPRWPGAGHAPLVCRVQSSHADLMAPAQVDKDSRFLEYYRPFVPAPGKLFVSYILSCPYLKMGDRGAFYTFQNYS